MNLTISQATLMMLAVAIVTFISLVSFSGTLVSIAATCEGIGEYHTGNGFMEDVDRYKDIVHGWVNYTFTGNGKVTDKFINIYSPEDMIPGNAYDCKSITNGIMCLAKLYNETCRFYTEFKWYDGPELKRGHLGIDCKIGDEWVTLY